MRAGPSFFRFSLTWMIVVPASLFVGLMIATAGTALYPPVTAIANPLICSGEVGYESHGASYRPGEYTVTRTVYCSAGAGKGAREDVTLKAVGVAFLLYSALAFVLLRFLAVPLLRRRFAARLDAVRSFQGASPADPAATGDLQSILARVARAVERGEGNVTVRNMRFDASAGGWGEGPGADEDPAERLAQLKSLRDQGLITAEDYEAKKAEILSRL